MAVPPRSSSINHRNQTDGPSRDELSGPPLAGLIPGAVLGVLLGAAFASCEAAMSGLLGLAAPDSGTRLSLLAFYLIGGAVLGSLAALGGLRGARWALGAVTIYAGWALCGWLSLRLGEWGIPGFLALLLFPAAVPVGWGFGKAPDSGAVTLGLAAGLGILLTTLGPLSLHVLGRATSPLALALDLLALVAAAFVGSAVAVLGGEGETGRVAVGLVLAGALGVGGTVLAGGAGAGIPLATADDRPAIVLIVVDSLRADHLGAWGYDQPTSPGIDALARRGTVWLDASSPAPWALPAMASLLTGVDPGKHGAGVNGGGGNLRTPIRADAPSLPRELRRHGYATAAVVSDRSLTAGYGFHRGFLSYDDRTGPGAAPLALFPLLAAGPPLAGLPWPPWPAWPAPDAVDITDRALEFVNAQRHPSWFLVVNYPDLQRAPLPSAVDRKAVSGGDALETLVAYDASVRGIDREVSRLVAGLPKRAYVVFTSTEGAELLENRQGANARPAGARNGHSVYQEILHVPLVVVGPGVPAARVARPVSLLDVAPTLLHLAGAQIPSEFQGFPLVEAVGGEVPADRALTAQAARYGTETRASRMGNWKLIDSAAGVQLFDLDQDPQEASPLVTTSPEVLDRVKTLHARLPPLGAVHLQENAGLGGEIADFLERIGRDPGGP